jgi:starch synthase (maltosyl-transferring)
LKNRTGTTPHDGITVNRTSQIVDTAGIGGAFHIENIYPIIDAGRFPVKRIVGPGATASS